MVFVTTPHECYIHDDGFRLKPNIAELLQYTDSMVRLFDRLRIRHHVINDIGLDARCDFVVKCIEQHRDEF